MIKNRNSMDLTEAGDIKKRGQEYTKEPYKKDLNDPDNHDGMITYLESDILECEIKWALGSITRNRGSEGDVIPDESFQDQYTYQSLGNIKFMNARKVNKIFTEWETHK